MIHLRSTLVMSTGVAVIIVGVVSSRKVMSAKVRLGLLEVLVRGEDDEGAVGGAVGGLGIFLLLKLANKNFDEVIELPFVMVGGLIEGVGTLLGTVAKQFTPRGDFTSAFNES